VKEIGSDRETSFGPVQRRLLQALLGIDGVWLPLYHLKYPVLPNVEREKPTDRLIGQQIRPRLL